MEGSSGLVKIGGVGQGGRDNQGTCRILASIDGVLRPAKVPWILSKAIRLSLTASELTKQLFVQICLPCEVSLDVLGPRYPCLELIAGMGIRLAVDTGYDDGEEMVLDFCSYHCQLAVVPFVANRHCLLGLKTLGACHPGPAT